MPAAPDRSGCSGGRRTRSEGDIVDESQLPGAREGHLAELFAAAGLREIADPALSVSHEHPTFEDWWEPFTHGVGPAGVFVAGLDPAGQTELRDLCRTMLPPAPFVLTARAWAARWTAA